MDKLVFHKCKICGAIFWHGSKTTYCTKCIPSITYRTFTNYYKTMDDAIERKRQRARDYYNKIKNVPEYVEARRERDRIRWHKRMENPAFKERERLRSLARARARKLATVGAGHVD